MRRRRPTPRRRDAPRWVDREWADATIALLRRSKGLCECCGTDLRGRGERHHRVRRRDGGDRLSNLCLLLPGHHANAHTAPAHARETGVIVLSTLDPATQPILHHGKRWVLLDDDGGVTPCDPPG